MEPRLSFFLTIVEINIFTHFGQKKIFLHIKIQHINIQTCSQNTNSKTDMYLKTQNLNKEGSFVTKEDKPMWWSKSSSNVVGFLNKIQRQTKKDQWNPLYLPLFCFSRLKKMCLYFDRERCEWNGALQLHPSSAHFVCFPLPATHFLDAKLKPLLSFHIPFFLYHC